MTLRPLDRSHPWALVAVLNRNHRPNLAHQATVRTSYLVVSSCLAIVEMKAVKVVETALHSVVAMPFVFMELVAVVLMVTVGELIELGLDLPYLSRLGRLDP